MGNRPAPTGVISVSYLRGTITSCREHRARIGPRIRHGRAAGGGDPKRVVGRCLRIAAGTRRSGGFPQGGSYAPSAAGSGPSPGRVRSESGPARCPSADAMIRRAPSSQCASQRVPILSPTRTGRPDAGLPAGGGIPALARRDWLRMSTNQVSPCARRQAFGPLSPVPRKPRGGCEERGGLHSPGAFADGSKDCRRLYR